MTALWAALAAPPLADQWRLNERVRATLSAAPLDQRMRAVDHPAFDVAHRIAEASPADACIAVAAYAGPAAIDYYNARFDYLLYPRRVSVRANSDAGSDDCEYLAVFRDTEANLMLEPFAGEWDEEELTSRTANLESVLDSGIVALYRKP